MLKYVKIQRILLITKGDVYTMDINYLEYFVIVAECGSINKAAKKLFMSQPHLSNIIKDLEFSIGTELFERTNRGVTITASGEYFLNHSKAILSEVEKLKEFTPATKKSSDSLRISMTKFTHVMECFNEVCSKKDNVDKFTYLLNEGTTKDVLNDVSSGYADVGVIHYDVLETKNMHGYMKTNNLEGEILAKFSPEICVSKHHELIKNNKKVTLDALRNYGFTRYIGQYEDFIYNITKNGHQEDLNNSDKTIYVYGRATLLNLISVSNCYTIGIMPFEHQNSLFDVLSVPIEGCEDTIIFEVITKKNAELNETTKEFINTLSQRFQKLSEQNAQNSTK